MRLTYAIQSSGEVLRVEWRKPGVSELAIISATLSMVGYPVLTYPSPRSSGSSEFDRLVALQPRKSEQKSQATNTLFSDHLDASRVVYHVVLQLPPLSDVEFIVSAAGSFEEQLTYSSTFSEPHGPTRPGLQSPFTSPPPA